MTYHVPQNEDNDLLQISGKSLISKERCIQTAEKEILAEAAGSKLKADPVFFISLVGVNEQGIVDEDEYIFDLYTKSYDFHGIAVKVVSAQDIWAFYQSKNRRADRHEFDIYFLVEYFIRHHQNGHFVLDECPFLQQNGKLTITQTKIQTNCNEKLVLTILFQYIVITISKLRFRF